MDFIFYQTGDAVEKMVTFFNLNNWAVKQTDKSIFFGLQRQPGDLLEFK